MEQIEYSANNSLKGIFKQGYGRICKYVMIYRSVSMPAKAVYGYLCTFTNPSYPSRELMCHDLRIAQNSLTKYLLELVQNDIISISKNLNSDNTYANNIYTISSDLEQRFKSLVTANSNNQNLVSENLKNSYPKNCNMDNLMDGNLMDGNLLFNNNKNNNSKTNNNRNNNNNILNNNKNSNNNRESENSLHTLKSILNNYSNNSSLIKTLTNFITFREKMDKPFKCEEQVIALLETLNNFNDDKTKIDCLNYSMSNSYTTIYLDFKNKPFKKNSSKSDTKFDTKSETELEPDSYEKQMCEDFYESCYDKEWFDLLDFDDEMNFYSLNENGNLNKLKEMAKQLEEKYCNTEKQDIEDEPNDDDTTDDNAKEDNTYSKLLNYQNLVREEINYDDPEDDKKYITPPTEEKKIEYNFLHEYTPPQRNTNNSNSHTLTDYYDEDDESENWN